MKRCGIHATRWPREPTVPCASSYANLPEDLPERERTQGGLGHGADVGKANSTWKDRQLGSGRAIFHGLQPAALLPVVS